MKQSLKAIKTYPYKKSHPAPPTNRQKGSLVLPMATASCPHFMHRRSTLRIVMTLTLPTEEDPHHDVRLIPGGCSFWPRIFALILHAAHSLPRVAAPIATPLTAARVCDMMALRSFASLARSRTLEVLWPFYFAVHPDRFMDKEKEKVKIICFNVDRK